MRYISKYRSFLINESIDIDTDKQDIIDIIVDIIDEGKYKISLQSPTTSKIFVGSEVHDKEALKDFMPVYKAANIRRSKFNLNVFITKSKTYDALIELLSEMSVVIKRLKDLGWNLTKMDTDSMIADQDINVDCDIRGAFYTFEKPDVEEEDPNFKPTKAGVVKLFNDIGLEAKDVSIEFNNGKWEINVEFESHEHDGELPRNIDDRFSRLVDRIGAKQYDYDEGSHEVTIYW